MMKSLLFACSVLVATTAAAQQITFADKDGYSMGPGTWNCQRVVAVATGDGGQDKSALVGWIMGAWSMSTFAREPGYSDIIEQVGGETIYIETVTRCSSAPAEELLHTVVLSMIDNTGN